MERIGICGGEREDEYRHSNIAVSITLPILAINTCYMLILFLLSPQTTIQHVAIKFNPNFEHFGADKRR
jgi:hypothetical protein